jgi:hypothetical protein
MRIRVFCLGCCQGFVHALVADTATDLGKPAIIWDGSVFRITAVHRH